MTAPKLANARGCPFCGWAGPFDGWPCAWLDGSGANVVRCPNCHGAAPAKTWNGMRAAAPQWQPIATAPKDGRRFLAVIEWSAPDGTRRSCVDVIYWYAHAGIWCAPTAINYIRALDDGVAPTHWMPRPALPDAEDR